MAEADAFETRSSLKTAVIRAFLSADGVLAGSLARARGLNRWPRSANLSRTTTTRDGWEGRQQVEAIRRPRKCGDKERDCGV
jgi:hypothetical protein